jgi:hypothetical protein
MESVFSLILKMYYKRVKIHSEGLLYNQVPRINGWNISNNKSYFSIFISLESSTNSTCMGVTSDNICG